MKEFIQKLIDRNDLTTEEAENAMNLIMSGNAIQSQMASFLTALRMKGESAEEIASFAKIMRKFAVCIRPVVSGTLVDVCGTGGDKIKTFNISTTSMFIIAAAGIPVAKHGNRAVTSKCGSADVLEELGINLNLSFEKIKESIERIGIGFMFAPLHHSAMKNVMPVRREIGIRTVFNILGPLSNPANAKAQLIGVYDIELTEKITEVLKILGLERAMVVHGDPGIDEISTIGRTKISELRRNEIRTYFIKPEDIGLKRAKEKDILGSSKEENAKTLKNILNGKESEAKRDITLLNAAAGIVIGGKARNLEEGLGMARNVLESGSAYEKLEQFIEFSKQENFP